MKARDDDASESCCGVTVLIDETSSEVPSTILFNVAYTVCSCNFLVWMKSWDVTIQMKPFQMKIFVVLFLIQVFKNDI